VIYFVATRDSNEQLLNGSNSYVMRFPADKLPQFRRRCLLSVILVGCPTIASRRLTHRFNFNITRRWRRRPTARWKIAIGPTPVAGAPESIGCRRQWQALLADITGPMCRRTSSSAATGNPPSRKGELTAFRS